MSLNVAQRCLLQDLPNGVTLIGALDFTLEDILMASPGVNLGCSCKIGTEKGAEGDSAKCYGKMCFAEIPQPVKDPIILDWL